MGYLRSVSEYDKIVKEYDPKLYAVVHKEGRIDIYRHSETKALPPHLIFSLTEDWTPRTEPVPWGTMPIRERLLAIDVWQRGDAFFEELDKQDEVNAEKRQRDFRNTTESFLLDFRRQFAKATDGINTASMRKINRH
jgi:hypothetical protein